MGKIISTRDDWRDHVEAYLLFDGLEPEHARRRTAQIMETIDSMPESGVNDVVIFWMSGEWEA